MKAKFLLISLIVFSIAGFESSAQIITNNDPYGLEKPLFQVKNRNQQTVFAVYPDGVKIYIDDKLKATGGGFTVGRLGTGKSAGTDFFIVKPNDVKVILNETTEKATGGGFTVGRLGTGKSSGSVDYLSVTPEQTRISVNDSVAGFAITNNDNGTSENILYLNKQNYFIGHNTGTQISTGIYNSTFGYESGKNLSTGNNNLIFGYKSGYMNSSGNDNVYIGNRAGEQSESASFSTYIGSNAGRYVTGSRNTFVGNQAGGSSGINKLDENNVCIGYQAGFNKSGSNKLYISNSDTDNPLIYGEFDNQKLTVNGELSVTGKLQINNELTVSSDLIAGSNLNVSNNLAIGNDFSVEKNATITGNLLIGSNLNVSGDFAVNNNLSVSSNLTVNNDLFVSNNLQTNNLTVTGEFTSPSDLNLKTNLVKMVSGLSLIQSLTTYYYDWNDDAIMKNGFSKTKQIGLIAQDVEKILPELVTDINGYKSVNYVKLVPVLVNAVNEQQNIIEGLKSDLYRLEQMIEKLTK